MKAFLGSFLMLLTAAMATACLPTTTSLPPTPATATAVAPALKRAPKQDSSNADNPYPNLPLPTVATSDEPYLAPPRTPTPPYVPYPYPLQEIETTPVPSEEDIFLATRAAELGVPELQGEQRQAAYQLYRWRQLSERELGYLRLAWDPILELRPGESHRFSVGLNTSIFNDFPLVDKQISWSISPTVGATIDPQTGYFKVDKDTPHGAVYTVTADVENGRASPTINVYIYTLAENPLIGSWQEEKQITCRDEDEIVPDNKIHELEFNADGTFSVVWVPFFEFDGKDYWGTYDYDKASGELNMTIEDGINVPADFDGSGFAADTDHRLRFKEMWLGSPPDGKSSINCGHVFFRYES